MPYGLFRRPASGVSRDAWLSLLSAQVVDLAEISGTTTISTNVSKVELTGSKAGFPPTAVYDWTIDLAGTSVVEHQGGQDWPWYPRKIVCKRAEVIFAEQNELGKPQVVTVSDLSPMSYIFAEWHPLVSCRLAPAAEDGVEVSQQNLQTLGGQANLRSGNTVFDGYMFTQTEIFNGVECHVFGTLKQAVYINASDLREVVGEIDGAAWFDSEGQFHSLANRTTTVRLNDEFSESSRIPIPLQTRYTFYDELAAEVGTVEVTTELTSESNLSVEFDRFEPYLQVDSEGSTPVGVKEQKPLSTTPVASSWSPLLWINGIVLFAIILTIAAKRRRA